MKRLVWASVVLFSIQLLLTVAAAAQNSKAQPGAKEVNPQAATATVSGQGTPGKLSKWTGIAGSSSYVLGDSNIYEDKFGKVGIGTLTPTSPLTVQGMIETTLGGYKFPDGTIQTTAATAGLQTVMHDTTLTGNGTPASPLGVAMPLRLIGSTQGIGYLLFVQNKGEDGTGVYASGGNSVAGFAGDGIATLGGHSDSGTSGNGIISFGGNTGSGTGGMGVSAVGGESNSGTGGAGIYAKGGFGLTKIGKAGVFDGDVEVTGNLSKGGGSFKIDHPLDPENKYLYHSFVESPDMMNIYNGNIMTDANGEAVVEMPDYFEALNRDFRYQLTVIGTFAQAIVAEKMKSNQFRIKTSAPNTEVSWQVTGVRHDAFANKNRIPVEEMKIEQERGFYLHPKAFGQSEERGIEWARHPELMQNIKQQRIQAEQQLKAVKN